MKYIFFVDITYQEEVGPSSAINLDDWRYFKIYEYFDVVYGRTYVLRYINILILVYWSMMHISSIIS